MIASYSIITSANADAVVVDVTGAVVDADAADVVVLPLGLILLLNRFHE